MLSDKHIDTIGGLLMIGALVLALILANSTSAYVHYIETPLFSSFSVKELTIDIVMILFFFSIGMELRQECHDGCLSDKRQILLPLMAALGGMIVPALIYMGINIYEPNNYPGFAIPCATDIAFALCLFNFIGRRLPVSIKVFLLSIAIFDDLGAILLIAFFYTADFHLIWFLNGLLPLILTCFCSHHRIASTTLYFLLTAALCFCFYQAGLHTTLGGFLIGFAMPLHKKSGELYLKRLQHRIHPFVQFIVLPLFAFTSSGIPFSSRYFAELFHPMVLGIFLGLFLGKQCGISLFSYFTLKMNWAQLPAHSQFSHIHRVSVIAGVGFTMSLFIGLLAFDDAHIQNLVKMGILLGSLSCVFLALVLTFWIKKK
jgi:Na+:H+ antiporter, NhaA family